MATFTGKCFVCGSQTDKTKTGRYRKYCNPCAYDVKLRIERISSKKWFKNNQAKIIKKKMVPKTPVKAWSVKTAMEKGVQYIPCRKLFRIAVGY